MCALKQLFLSSNVQEMMGRTMQEKLSPIFQELKIIDVFANANVFITFNIFFQSLGMYVSS